MQATAAVFRLSSCIPVNNCGGRVREGGNSEKVGRYQRSDRARYPVGHTVHPQYFHRNGGGLIPSTADPGRYVVREARRDRPHNPQDTVRHARRNVVLLLFFFCPAFACFTR